MERLVDQQMTELTKRYFKVIKDVKRLGMEIPDDQLSVSEDEYFRLPADKEIGRPVEEERY